MMTGEEEHSLCEYFFKVILLTRAHIRYPLDTHKAVRKPH